MAVPNTNTFTLENVRTEIGLGSTTSLEACFSNAVAWGFDPAYEGSKNSLLNFRNYNHSATPPTSPITLGRGTTGAIACTRYTTEPDTWYSAPNASTFLLATGIYSDAAATIPAPADWYSNGVYRRQWTGTAFTGSPSLCD